MLNRNAFKTREASIAHRLAFPSHNFRGPPPEVLVQSAVRRDCRKCNIIDSTGQRWCIGPCLLWRHHDEP